MRGGKLKELAASAAGKAISSSSSADSTVESLSSLFVATLKKSPSALPSTEEKSENIRVEELIVTRRRLNSSVLFGPRALSSSGLGDAKKKPSKPLVRVSAKALSVLKEEASQGKVRGTPAAGNKSAVDVVLQINSALQGETGSLRSSQSEATTNNSPIENSLHDMDNIFKSHMQKERSRERKARWTHKNTQDFRFSHLIKRSADTLGTENTLEVLGKLGKETGIKEYNALISCCIDKARQSSDEDGSLAQLQKAFQLFRSMKEQGFQIEEESYGPLLMYLIEMEMLEEFQNISEVIKKENPQAKARICYYEMLLWIRVANEEKIQDVCNSLQVDDDDDCIFSVAENYLLAFCESDRKKEILDLLKDLDIRRISSPKYVSLVFKSLGKQSLENVATKFFLALKGADERKGDVSSFIFDYTSNIPNLAVKEVVSKFIGLHEKLTVAPSNQSCDKFIVFCCNSFKVHAALSPILRGTEEIYELRWVRELCSIMWRHSLKPNKESSKSMISVYVTMKDFEGAYNLLVELKGMNMKVDTSMYNAIMIGHFKEKNIHGGLLVLKQMKNANIKPDSETFSYLLSNCECEEDIVKAFYITGYLKVARTFGDMNKFLDELKHFQLDFTKHIYIALVNAYANCGKFDQAKQVIMDKCVPVEHINEIKGALVSAFSLKGRISDALEMYDAMKQAGCRVEPKVIAIIIDFLQSKGQIDRLLQLLAELNDSCFWFDACCRIVLYCVRYNLLSSAVGLLKQLKSKDEMGTCTFIDQMFSHIWEVDPTNVEIGMALLQTVKHDLGLHPSRISLDFLLSACVKMNDLKSARQIWAEYSKAGLPFNVLTYLRMYQAFLASGDFKGAEKMLKKIPEDDKNVRDIVKACKTAYSNPILRSGKLGYI